MSLVLKNRNSENQNRENPDTMEISETSKEGSASRSQNSSLPEKKEPTQSSQSSATSSRQPQTTTSTEQKVSAEELRRRRLARFGGGGGGETMSSHISPSPPLSSTNTPPTNTTNLSSESSNVRVSSAPITIAARHTSRLVNTEPPAEPMEIETPFLTTHNTKTPTLTPPHSPLFLNSSSFSPSQPSYLSQSPVLFKSPPTSPLAVSPSSPLSVLPYEEWEHNTIKSILQISPSSNSRNGIVSLESFSNFLQKQNKNLELLNRTHIDQILIFILTLRPESLTTPPLTYLARCHSLAAEEKQRSSVKNDPKRVELLTYMQQLFVSYFGLIIQFPDNFPFYAKTPQNQIVSEIVTLLQPNANGLILFSSEFIEQLIQRFKSEGLTQIFEPIFEELLTLIRATSLLNNFLTYFNAFSLLIRHKALREMLFQLGNWIPNKRHTGKEMEVNSFLGPLFRLTSFSDDPQIGFQCIPPSAKSSSAQQEALSDVRARLHLAQRGAYEILLTFLKAAKEEREYVLKWLGHVLERNNARNKLHVDRITVASDGFMINITAVLLKLCEPFLVPNSPKISMIDPEYFVKSNRLSIDEDTRLGMSLEEAKAWSKKQKEDFLNSVQDPSSERQVNFVSECFFMTMKSFNLGVLKIFERYAEKMKKLNELKAKKRNLEALISSLNTLEIADYDELTEKIDKENQIRLCIEAQLLDPSLLLNSLKFFNLAAVWLLKIASKDTILDQLTIPLPHSPPQCYAYLPEYFVDSIADFLIFMAQFAQSTLDSFPLDDFMSFLVTFIGSPPYIKNPHLRSKLVEVLYLLTPKNFGRTLRINIFERNFLAKKYLMPSLMRFYVEVEHTGLSTQFYDKFNVRYYISFVMRYLWKFPLHQETFRKEAQDQSRFLTFVNMVINDAIFLLDESLAKLTKIRNIQMDMASAEWNKRPSSERREIDEEYDRLERQVRAYLLLAHETLRMFHYLARDVPTYFIKEKETDMVDRLASMLNYFLLQLAGPKCLDLKVKNPEKYNFNPKWLLKKIVMIYLHFSRETEFLRAVARDVRSYSHDVFVKAARILQRERLVNEETLNRFNHFVESVQQIAQKEKSIEDLIDEAPAEFLDPILSTIMRDPVILPSSRVTVDRATIVRHLLSDQTDPFNRSHLTVDMLIPNVELKEKITNWIASKMKQ